MAHVTNCTTNANLSCLPSELRLRIYDFMQRQNPEWETHCTYLDHTTDFVARDIGKGPRGQGILVPLSKTCKKIRHEVDDILYKQRFAICTQGTYPRDYQGLCLSEAGWICFSRMRLVHLDIEIPQNLLGSDIGLHISTLKKLLKRLRESTGLQVFTVAASDMDSVAAFENKKRELRRTATKEGVRAGKTAKERELDYALMLVELFETWFAKAKSS